MSDFEKGFTEELQKLGALRHFTKPWEAFSAAGGLKAMQKGQLPTERQARAAMGPLEEAAEVANKEIPYDKANPFERQEAMMDPEILQALRRDMLIKGSLGTAGYGGAGLAGGGMVHGLTGSGEPQV